MQKIIKPSINKKMNWYAEKIIEEMVPDESFFKNTNLFFMTISSEENFKNKDIPGHVTICDADGHKFNTEFNKNNKYFDFIKEENIYKRNYSNKLFAYSCNLLELYMDNVYPNDPYRGKLEILEADIKGDEIIGFNIHWCK